jgi:hypothetical protein
MVQPDDVVRMANRVAWVPERDDLIDFPVLVAQADVSEPRREVRGALTTETVLGCQYNRGFMPFLTERLDERACDHEVSAFDE